MSTTRRPARSGVHRPTTSPAGSSTPTTTASSSSFATPTSSAPTTPTPGSSAPSAPRSTKPNGQPSTAPRATLRAPEVGQDRGQGNQPLRGRGAQSLQSLTLGQSWFTPLSSHQGGKAVDRDEALKLLKEGRIGE